MGTFKRWILFLEERVFHMAAHPFPYLARFAKTYGKDDVQIKHLQEEIIRALSKKDLDNLAQAYQQIVDHKDQRAISKWINDKVEDGLTKERRETLLLLFLLSGLSRQGIVPFCLESVFPEKDEEKLEWQKLPEDLRYLTSPAERYSVIQFDDDIDEFADSMDERARAELQAIAPIVDRDEKKIDAFLDEYRMTEHREANLVYFLTYLIATLREMGKLL